MLSPREYELDAFNGVAERFDIINKIPLFEMIKKIPFVHYRIIALFLRIFTQHENSVPSKWKRRYVGYYQSEKYFKHCASDVLKMFEFDASMFNEGTIRIANEIKKKKVLSLHVRRGDYLRLKNIYSVDEICNIEYYTDSYNFIKNKNHIDKVLIFSDDPKWAMENLNFINKDKEIIKHNIGKDAFQDIYLMSLCDHHIIANSSFSWWGAWLSTKNGVVVAPKRWFKDRSKNDIYCKGWVRL